MWLPAELAAADVCEEAVLLAAGEAVPLTVGGAVVVLDDGGERLEVEVFCEATD